ncbi:MAG: response regulator [Anaerolineae bacterium]
MRRKTIRVLLIEDNPGDVRLVREMLKGTPEFFFEIKHRGYLRTGLERLSAGGIDVVLLDLSLPDSLLGDNSLLRTYAMAPDVPIIVLTGLDDEALGRATVRAGAHAHVIKGQTDAETLIELIRSAVVEDASDDDET